MVWGAVERAYYLGCDCVPELEERDKERAECTGNGDIAFLERYCRADKHGQPGTHTRLGKVSVAVARCVINQLAKLFPTLGHSSPWWAPGPQPVIVMGCVSKGFRVQRPRLGLCQIDDHLYLWADQKTVVGLGLNARNWQHWRGAPGADDSQVYFNCSLRCTCPTLEEMPEDLLQFLQCFKKSIDCGIDRCLTEAIRGSRQAIGLPSFDVVVPRDKDDFEEDEHSEVENNHEQMPKAEIISESALLESAVSSNSMLAVVRALAIARVQTRINEFGAKELDDWIMSTGYPSNAGYGGQPHQDTIDLFYVFAASMANAAGGRPPFSEFATMIVNAIRRLNVINGCGRLDRSFNALDLASFIEKINQPANVVPRIVRFKQNVTNYRSDQSNTSTDSALLESVAAFSEWLLKNYEGCACNLAADFRNLPKNNGDVVFGTIDSLDAIKGVGIAIAANFLKDSQIPGLRSAGHDPRAVKQFLAGWVAKPDLHVTRLMAKITRNFNIRVGGRLQPWPVALACYESAPINQGEAGYFDGEYPMGMAFPKRVIVDIHDWARCCETSPLEIDRVLYLIGAKRPEINGKPIIQSWYDNAEHWIGHAIENGVPRKS